MLMSFAKKKKKHTEENATDTNFNRQQSKDKFPISVFTFQIVKRKRERLHNAIFHRKSFNVIICVAKCIAGKHCYDSDTMYFYVVHELHLKKDA